MRHLKARRLLTIPVAAVAILALGAFGGDGDKEDKRAKQQSDDKVLIDEDFVDDRNSWGGESTPELEVRTDEETETFDWFVNQDIDFFVEYYPDVLLSKADKLRDVRVEADVSFVAPGAPGLTCRSVDPTGEAGNQETYIFIAHPTGHVVIQKRLADGTLEKLASSADTSSEAVFDGPGAAEGFINLRGECVGGKGGKPVTLTMSVDGEEVLEVKDDQGYAQGGAHLFSAKSAPALEASGFAPFVITWDTFKLTEL